MLQSNALCHRDYQLAGGSVTIAVFDDRLEIANTGRLPFGLRVEDLLKPHQSRPWNPLVAAVLYRRGLIEQWGRGTLRIRKLVEQAGLAAPEFEVRAGEVVVRFFPSGYVVPRRVDHALTPLQQRTLSILAASGPARLGELAQALDPSEVTLRNLQYTLQSLRTLGLVDYSGRGRAARWRILAKAQEN